MAEHVVHVRLVAVGFLAQCLVCTRWCHVRLPWRELDRADDLRSGGECEADVDTAVTEIEVGGVGSLAPCSRPSGMANE